MRLFSFWREFQERKISIETSFITNWWKTIHPNNQVLLQVKKNQDAISSCKGNPRKKNENIKTSRSYLDISTTRLVICIFQRANASFSFPIQLFWSYLHWVRLSTWFHSKRGAMKTKRVKQKHQPLFIAQCHMQLLYQPAPNSNKQQHTANSDKHSANKCSMAVYEVMILPFFLSVWFEITSLYIDRNWTWAKHNFYHYSII